MFVLKNTELIKATIAWSRVYAKLWFIDKPSARYPRRVPTSARYQTNAGSHLKTPSSKCPQSAVRFGKHFTLDTNSRPSSGVQSSRDYETWSSWALSSACTLVPFIPDTSTALGERNVKVQLEFHLLMTKSLCSTAHLCRVLLEALEHNSNVQISAFHKKCVIVSTLCVHPWMTLIVIQPMTTRIICL